MMIIIDPDDELWLIHSLCLIYLVQFLDCQVVEIDFCLN